MRTPSSWYTTPFGRLVAGSERPGTKRLSVAQTMQRLRDRNGF